MAEQQIIIRGVVSIIMHHDFVSDMSRELSSPRCFHLFEEYAGGNIAADKSVTRSGDEIGFGWAMAIFSVGRIVGSPVIGYWADKRSQKEALLGSIAIIALGSVMYLLSPNMAVMLISRVIIGFGGGTFLH